MRLSPEHSNGAIALMADASVAYAEALRQSSEYIRDRSRDALLVVASQTSPPERTFVEYVSTEFMAAVGMPWPLAHLSGEELADATMTATVRFFPVDGYNPGDLESLKALVVGDPRIEYRRTAVRPV